MKKLKLIFMSLGIAAMAFLGNSCDNSGYSLGDVWYSLVTVRPLDGAYYLTTDKGTSLWPAATDIHWYKPKEKHRALAFYTLLSDEFHGYDHAIKVLSIQDILTKPIAEDKGEENDTHYGDDPVKILDMWIGDGYLNVEFGFNYGGSVKHFINLLKASDVNTPYAFEFRHNAYHDSAYERRKGLVSFDLSTLDTGGQEVELSIRVKTFEGDKNYTVKYQPGAKESKEIQRNLSDDFVEIE
ncbi:MAG: NigD-like protein [Tannerella sp.]|jgi:hypothetical protein|nr:NigD-like protein [Tannerella sp.]